MPGESRTRPAQAIYGKVQRMGCTPCGRGFHKECRKGCKSCHPLEEMTVHEEIEDVPEKRKKNNLLDPKSTGRKRAARLYPIIPDDPCEWKGKKNCGGGRRPIIGCYDGTQKHRHHGPIKDTTRNEQGNVHRICTSCHIHWHELNDLIYDSSDYELLPHAPVDATDLETIQNALDWQSGEIGRKYELASSRNKAGVSIVD